MEFRFFMLHGKSAGNFMNSGLRARYSYGIIPWSKKSRMWIFKMVPQGGLLESEAYGRKTKRRKTK